MAIPIAAIPAMIALEYVLDADPQYRHVVWCLYILAIIYQVGYGFNFWAAGDRSRWKPAFNILTGVMIGPVVLGIWVNFVIKTSELLRIPLRWIFWI